MPFSGLCPLVTTAASVVLVPLLFEPLLLRLTPTLNNEPTSAKPVRPFACSPNNPAMGPTKPDPSLGPILGLGFTPEA